MKDKIESLKKTFNEGLELLKEQKVDEAIAKMAEVAPILKELEDGEDEAVQKIAKSQETLVKTEDLLKTAQESIQKWADFFVTAENAQELFQQIKDGADLMKNVQDLSKKVEELEKVATSRQKDGAPVKKTKEEILSEVKLG